MTNNHRIAVDLRDLFGVSARDPTFDLMWDYEARGLVDDSPGPRGGAGWSLSSKGAALIAGTLTPTLPVRAS